MRREQPAALVEFFRRFRPLLIQEARWLGVQPGLREELVDECLDDVALRLLRHTTPVPRAIAPYLVRALRLHRLEARRGETRRANAVAEPSADEPASADRVELTGSERADAMLSESARRESRGPSWEPCAASPALERLVGMLEEGLGDDDALLLTWVGNWVPQSEIAAWLGITHGAARNRVLRLRERLRNAAMRAAASFSREEQAELTAFFRRAAIVDRAAPMTHGARDAPPERAAIDEPRDGGDPSRASGATRHVTRESSDATRP